MMDRLTFGRNLSFVAEMSIVSIPVIFSAAMQSPPTLFVRVGTPVIAGISLISVLFSLTFSYFLLLNVGKSTYSTKLHDAKYILTSVTSLFVLSILIVFIGYLVFVFHYSRMIIPDISDLFAGLFVASLYVTALSGVNAVSVWSEERKKEKQKVVKEFLSSTSELKRADLGEADMIASTVVSSGRGLEKGLRKEPMPDTVGPHSSLSQWLDDFEDYSLSDKRRMVGWTSGQDVNRTEPWKTHYSTLTELRKRLSKLDG